MLDASTPLQSDMSTKTIKTPQKLKVFLTYKLLNAYILLLNFTIFPASKLIVKTYL